MPYVFVDELTEGQEEANVISVDDYNALTDKYNAVIEERDEVITQRDGLITSTEQLQKDLREAKSKYANAFLTSAQQIKDDNKRNIQSENRPQSFEALFNGRE